MNEGRKKKERGSVEVEATFIFPIMILCIILLLYLSLIMYQRANLQATLETSLMYYKNTLTDTFVIRNGEMDYQYAENSYIGNGNDYVVEGPKSPYRLIEEDYRSNEYLEEKFRTYFDSVATNMLFDENITTTFDYKNFILLKEIEVTAKQEIEIPIDLSILGLENKYVISATARVVAVDHEDTVRNIDYVIYIVEKTKVGDFIKDVMGKGKDVYEKFTSSLGITSSDE